MVLEFMVCLNQTAERGELGKERYFISSHLKVFEKYPQDGGRSIAMDKKLAKEQKPVGRDTWSVCSVYHSRLITLMNNLRKVTTLADGTQLS